MQASLTSLGYWSLCSIDCRIKFLKRWLRVHFEQGAALGEAMPLAYLTCKPAVCSRGCSLPTSFWSAVKTKLVNFSSKFRVGTVMRFLSTQASL